MAGKISLDGNDGSTPQGKAEDLDSAAAERAVVGHVPDFEELEGANHPPMPVTGKLASIKWLFFEGGTPFDAFLTAASAQVGQVILTLPHSLSETNIIGGTILQLTFATWAMYTLYLMVILYLDYKNRKIKAGTWYTDDGKSRAWCTQYFEMIGDLTHKYLGWFTLVVCVLAALGSCLPQIVASSSNVYIINKNLNKRDWALIFGGIMTLLAFVPTFRNMRLFAIWALIGTTFTSWYMIGTSIHAGVHNSVWTAKPIGGLDGFFDGLTNILFTFGGHFMLLEVLDSMFRPGRFHKVFACSYSYVFTLTIPNTILTYWAFPAEVAEYGNAFAVFPANRYRNTAIILMISHQMIAFLLFIMPVFYMWEKMLRIHNKPLYVRLPLRLPLSGLVWLIAVAFPFYNVINSILGAFTTSFETFMIPTGVFNWVYRTQAARDASPKKPMKCLGWTGVFILNTIIFVSILVCGVGFGMYAAVKSFISEVSTFGVFPACYQC